MAKKAAQSEDTNYLLTEVRDTFGKGVARKIRAQNKIPAVIYGHGTEPKHVTLPGHETALILRKSNQVLELDIQGTIQLALVKDVQKDPVRQIIEHIDLIVVRKGEKVIVDIPVHVEGEPVAGTTINQDANTVSLEVEATHIPENVVVSVEGLKEGSQILAKDLTLPTGATLVTDEETLIVGITGEVEQDLGDEPETEEGAEGAEAAEGDDAAAEESE
ncbi:large subunit ribosomal protein L25 [Salinibacterium sp. CAN_S4]|uniref:50S ribosomal protein L25/general stress protein Ctc n=1 Tax=Salinibacterium sp. CAN_S4 TaxID=2787727 RepID=UPI0018F0208B